MITIIIGNTKCKVANLTDPLVIKAIDMQLSYDVQGFKFMKVDNNWDGRYRLLTKNHYFPIGMLPAVEKILQVHGYKWSVMDNRGKLVYGGSQDIDQSSGFIPRDYQLEVVDAAWKHGSGIVRSATGCHRAGQNILMFDGSIKKVEDVIIGDKIMGPDSSSRTVLSLCRGKDRMVRIIPVKGEPFVVNKEHILSLKRTRRKSGDKLAGNIVDVKVSEYIKWNNHQKHIHKLFRVPVDFCNKVDLKIDPYFMGLFLGDDSAKHGPAEAASKEYSHDGSFEGDVGKNKTYEKVNKLRAALRDYNLIGCGADNKFVPMDYKTSSRMDRLEILAGILDSKGTMLSGGFNFISKSKSLSNDVAYIARSVGLAAYIKICKKEFCSDCIHGDYYRVSISGDCSIIPNRIRRKKARPRRQKKDVLVTGFKIEELDEELYYGFQVDSDNRYLLGDFTVTHNSGKSLMIAMITARFNVKTVIYVIGIELLYQMKETIERAYPSMKVGMVGDGHCDIQDITIATIWSAAAAFGKKAKLLDSDSTSHSKKKTKKAALKKEEVRSMVMNAEMMFIDECQYAASETVQLLHRQSQCARHRFLFSGTPWRDGGDDLLIEAVGGPKIYDLNATTLIRNGWLVQPKIYFLDVPTIRGVGKTYQEVYKNFVVENEVRNDLIVKSVHRLIEKNRKVLVLVTKIAHGKHLESLLEKDLRVSSLDGSNKTADRIGTIQDMKDGKLDVLIASKIFDQGIDIPELDALVLAGSGKSSARALQRVGRVIRRGKEGSNKKDAIVVDFFDNCKYLRDHTHVRNRIYSTEPGFRIIMPKRD